MLPNDWPVEVCQYLTDRWGEPTGLEKLAGLSGSRVYRLRWNDQSLVLKGGLSRREGLVYQQLGPLFEQDGISIPRLEYAWQSGSNRWLLLEDIPSPLPRSRWWDDPAVVGLLYRLHNLPLTVVPKLTDLFRPGWTDAVTLATLDCCPSSTHSALRPLLQVAQFQSQPFFEPRRFISGDPNVLNWGVRGDGTVVLFDWERFGLGTPIIDLAILHPGLGNQASFSRLAAAYLAFNPPLDLPLAVERLTQDLWMAKVWNMAEFFHLYATRQVTLDPADMTARAGQFADWMLKNTHHIHT